MEITLGDIEILAWLMEVDAPPDAKIDEWRACLHVDLARVDRFYLDADRVTFVAAHWLLRTALSEVGKLPPAHWRFVMEKYGKPQVDPALGRLELASAYRIPGGLSHVRCRRRLPSAST